MHLLSTVSCGPSFRPVAAAAYTMSNKCWQLHGTWDKKWTNGVFLATQQIFNLHSQSILPPAECWFNTICAQVKSLNLMVHVCCTKSNPQPGAYVIYNPNLQSKQRQSTFCVNLKDTQCSILIHDQRFDCKINQTKFVC